MIRESSKTILYIEPKNDPLKNPLIDDYVIMMYYLINNANIENRIGSILPNGNYEEGIYTKGVHKCSCGAKSTNIEYNLEKENLLLTNWLAPHYLMYHRDEIFENEMKKIVKLYEKFKNSLDDLNFLELMNFKYNDITLQVKNLNYNYEEIDVYMFNVIEKYNKYIKYISLFGWIIGDMAGIPFEFNYTDEANESINEYLNVSNELSCGGQFNIPSGCSSDDTEMGLIGLAAILNIKFNCENENATLEYINNDNNNVDTTNNINNINNNKYEYTDFVDDLLANNYVNWAGSEPFDIGNTIKSVLCDDKKKVLNYNKKANELRLKASKLKSMSNGSLMRIAGIIIVLRLNYNLNLNEILKIVEKDMTMTHSNFKMKYIIESYTSMLIKSLEKNITWKDVYESGRKYCESSSLLKSIYESVDADKDYFFDDTLYKLSDIDKQMQGFCGFSIWLLLRCLKKHNNYYNFIVEICSLGGDTDTNCCIIGPIIASLYPNTIPKIWINQMIQRCELNQKPRNKFIDPLKQIFDIIQ